MPTQNHQSYTTSLGFTFLELLIVISTMALFFSLGFANYREYQARQKIISVARILRADLRFTQEQALGGIKPQGVTCNSLNGYQFEYVNPTTYRIQASCDSIFVESKSVDISKMSSQIEIESPFPPVFFNVLGRGVRISGTSIPITLIKTGSTDNIIITVTKGGEIN